MATSHSYNAASTVAELPDSFFDVTADDCMVMQRDLHRQVEKLIDAPLITTSLRQTAQLERFSRYNKVVL